MERSMNETPKKRIINKEGSIFTIGFDKYIMYLCRNSEILMYLSINTSQSK